MLGVGTVVLVQDPVSVQEEVLIKTVVAEVVAKDPNLK